MKTKLTTQEKRRFQEYLRCLSDSETAESRRMVKANESPSLEYLHRDNAAACATVIMLIERDEP